MDEESAYELERAANIAANQARLQELGLALKPADSAARERTPRRSRSRRAEPIVARASKRLRAQAERNDAQGGGESAADALTTVPATSIAAVEPTWHSALFAAPSASKAASRLRRSVAWDRRACHQHLTLSSDRLAVATIGCAGYGGCLSHRDGGFATVRAGRSAGRRVSGAGFRWSVEVLSVGVGGFAVGLASTSMRKPFKSLGNTPLAWMWHCNGTVLHNRQRRPADNPPLARAYQCSDVIGLTVNSDGRVRASRNGSSVHLDFPKLPKGEYVLAVQPYMGGAARIVEAQSL